MSVNHKLYGVIESKKGTGMIFPEKQACLLQKPVGVFHQSMYQSTFQLLEKTYLNVNSRLRFLAKATGKCQTL